MQVDFEERVLRNPALGAVLVAEFAESFAEHAVEGSAPTLPHVLVGLPMLFHEPTVQRIHRMRFESGLARALAEQPLISLGLQQRVTRMKSNSLEALAVGCAAGLLEREGGHGFPAFRATRKRLPAFDVTNPTVGPMAKAGRRLGAWFAAIPFANACRLLRVEF